MVESVWIRASIISPNRSWGSWERRGCGGSRADGDRGATRRGGATAGNRFGDRRGSDGQPLDSIGGESQESGCGRQRSPRVCGGAVRRLGKESYGLRYG